jgi:repressor LexA
MKGLTDKQQEILDYIAEFMKNEQMAPTVYEIADRLQITTATTFAHLRALQRKGYLSRSSKARSIALLKSDPVPRNMGLMINVPIIGRVSAGAPLLAEQHVEATIQFDPALLPLSVRRQILFGLRVNGDSMQEMGIYDGDIVIARQTDMARNGDVVVAMVDGDTTVKNFHLAGDQIELRPANHEYPCLAYPRQKVAIQGVIVALQRTF